MTSDDKHPHIDPKQAESDDPAVVPSTDQPDHDSPQPSMPGTGEPLPKSD